MTRDEVQEKVFGILTEQLNLEEVLPTGVVLSLEHALIDDLKADSLDLVELQMEFEDEFGIQIPESKMESMQTVAKIVDYICENV